MIWACSWRCLSFLYCCLKAEMSTVSLSLSTFCCEGPIILWPLGWGLEGEVLGEGLKRFVTPKAVAATANPSSSSSSSSSLKRKRKSIYVSNLKVQKNSSNPTGQYKKHWKKSNVGSICLHCCHVGCDFLIKIKWQ